ncbi:MAG: DUF1553 domain-containing protein [Planctomycetales bacterium]|nr:DUF1553 domain-containing protein [Planctomycetales bacterium]
MRRLIEILVCVALLPATARAAEPIDYAKRVKPILAARCYACHGALKQKAGLRLDTGLSIRRGGDSGPAVKPMDIDGSLLIERVTATDLAERMPPEGEPLTGEQIQILKAWVRDGAMSPEDERPEENPRDHWAFRTPVRPMVPAVKLADRVRNPIDNFVMIELERRDLKPNPLADKSTLLRRVHFDLIGLPPTRDELHAFLADESPEAYEKVVENLLVSPQHGERWARHWMDVWRYSDWYGRRAVPDVWNSAPQVWRWRDWIIKSLNSDKGYDAMLREMLAADEVAPENDEAQVATGYLARNWYALNPNQWMREIVEHTGKAFLGLTFNCAHCHDHKYDPISQEEYFRFRAFFEPIDLRQDRVRGEPDPGPFQKYEYSVLRKIQQLGRVSVFDARPDAKTQMYQGGDERNIEKMPTVGPGVPAFLGGDSFRIEPVSLPVVAFYPGAKPWLRTAELASCEQAVKLARTALDVATIRATAAMKVILEVEEQERQAAESKLSVDPKLAAKRQSTEQRLREVQADQRLTEMQLNLAQSQLDLVLARIAADDAKHTASGGNINELARAAGKTERLAALRSAEEKLAVAEKVRVDAQSAAADKQKVADQQVATAKVAVEAATRALAAESATYTPLTPTYPQQSTGRRKALAEWITHADQPLTPRVAINHIWARHFGRPLVATVADFGRSGAQPTHPELLDWLAVELREHGWSMKHIHRLIVTSATYRQSSATDRMRGEAAAPIENRQSAIANSNDLDNHWLWRFPERRLEAEPLRDAMLFVSGELEAQMFGQPLPNDPESMSRRRAIYFSVYPEDGGAQKFLEMFDAPDPCDCYRRMESIVPQQALVLTNSRFALHHSRVLGCKLTQEFLLPAGTDDTSPRQANFVRATFEQVLSRLPTEQELAACLDFLQRQTESLAKSNAAPAPIGNPPIAAPSTNPAQRARESLVRALFNHNDFATVR